MSIPPSMNPKLLAGDTFTWRTVVDERHDRGISLQLHLWLEHLQRCPHKRSNENQKYELWSNDLVSSTSPLPNQ